MSHFSSFCDALAKAELDAAILTSSVSQRYLSNFLYHDGYLLVVGKKGYLITDFRYEEAARAKASPELEVLCPDCGMLVCIAGLLSEAGARRVAIEESSLSVSALERMKKTLTDFELCSGASEILSELRTCKNADELAVIDRAQRITDAAFSHILKALTPSMTEIDVALELEFFMRRSGADGIAFNTIAVSGSASSLPHGTPRPCKLERGFLTMDFGASVDGYCADMTRTVVLGRADEDMKHLYNTVLRAQTAAIEAASEGCSCFGLDKIARDIIEGAGYKNRFGHSLGHGVGMHVHEEPRLSPKTAPEKKLCRGHVVTVEPGIYLAGKYGCRIEDMIAIDNSGNLINFTKSPKELTELF
ncbi:MAG: aminopeptidase P family protein [Clostridia bacterium]|nr:aminopeptidase P family protein [Clostridia bacterium]